jgi:uncharacterized membrane protein (Fun14 family)
VGVGGGGLRVEHLLFSVHISSIDGCSVTGVIHISACVLSAFFHLMLLFSTSLSDVILGLRVYSDNFCCIFFYIFQLKKKIVPWRIYRYASFNDEDTFREMCR